MLPAKADRSADQNNLVAIFYSEYAALNCDVYELDAMQQAVCRDKSLTAAEADARLAALYQLEAETFEFNPACCE